MKKDKIWLILLFSLFISNLAIADILDGFLEISSKASSQLSEVSSKTSAEESVRNSTENSSNLSEVSTELSDSDLNFSLNGERRSSYSSYQKQVTNKTIQKKGTTTVGVTKVKDQTENKQDVDLKKETIKEKNNSEISGNKIKNSQLEGKSKNNSINKVARKKPGQQNNPIIQNKDYFIENNFNLINEASKKSSYQQSNPMIRARNYFIKDNFNLIKQQAAQGKGNSLNTLGALYLCQNKDLEKFKNFLKENYFSIFPSPATAEFVQDKIDQLIKFKQEEIPSCKK